MHSILIIGKVWPEENTTGAGVRMMQILTSLAKSQYQITFACAAQTGEYSTDLKEIGVKTEKIQLNCDSFNSFIQALKPEIVLFDRFSTEEQFGWRVQEELPFVLRILDTEDLHFLRAAREKTFEQVGYPYTLEETIETALELDITYREIAAMLRCDVNLIISQFEIEFLNTYFPIPETQLFYLPLLPSGDKVTLSFSERKDFIFVGNFLHQPNKDAFHYLHLLWPKIKQQLPDVNICIYGAYADNSILHLNNVKSGFIVQGWVEDLTTEIAKSRMLIAPLRFGAGLKSKILEALNVGTPVATTSIGAEGIEQKSNFSGVIGDCDDEWMSAIVNIYKNESAWKPENAKALKTIYTKFQGKELENFPVMIQAKLEQLTSNRKNQFLQKLVLHETLKSSKYLSKWIIEKNKA
jgi:glycosyltransferase involved in cell wall biosynthesis